jgi:AbrB family looped-hinge helix DNA binding protein
MSTDGEGATETTRITRKGQVTIPKALRDRLGLEAGDEVRWRLGEEGIVVRKATQSVGRGLLSEDRSADERQDLADAMEAAIRSKRAEEWNGE